MLPKGLLLVAVGLLPAAMVRSPPRAYSRRGKHESLTQSESTPRANPTPRRPCPLSILALLASRMAVNHQVRLLALYAVTLLPDPPITPKFKNLMKLAIILAVIIALLPAATADGKAFHIVARLTAKRFACGWPRGSSLARNGGPRLAEPRHDAVKQRPIQFAMLQYFTTRSSTKRALLLWLQLQHALPHLSA